MGRYSGVVLGITPDTGNDNWSLNAAANESGCVLEVHWGGQATTSTAMQTSIARSASGSTLTAGDVQKLHPNTPTNLMDFVKNTGGADGGWTTQPTLTAGALFAESWNAHGGVVRWLAAPGEEFVIIGAATPAQMSCRNAVGTATSSYGVIWQED